MLWLSKKLAMMKILQHWRIETALPRDRLGYVAHTSDHYTLTENAARARHARRYAHRDLRRGEVHTMRLAR